ncbi:MAG: iron ABC transporter permease [Solirubrobacteraceae bacterium]|nr:iron ABC transporter permease [Solirubrobacteraceae bacterium]
MAVVAPRRVVPEVLTRRTSLFAASGLLLLLGLVVADLLQGAGGIPASAVWEALRHGAIDTDTALVIDGRLPRAAAGVIAGATLAGAAVLLQALTRNPLAEGATLGLTAGGALAVTIAAAYFPVTPGVTTTSAAFVGVLAAGFLVAGLSAAAAGGQVRMILAGMAVTLSLSAVTAAIHLVRETETSGLFFWGAGSLLQQGWANVEAAALVGGIALVAAFVLGRALDILALGDSAATALGQRVGRLKIGTGLAATLLCAAAVSVAGPISFVGIVGAQMAWWAGTRTVAATLAVALPWGAAMVIGADVLARVLFGATSETPAGVVCAVLGAPMLVFLASRTREEAAGSIESRASAARFRPVAVAIAAVLIPLLALASLGMGELRVAPLDLVQAMFGTGDPLAEIAIELRAPRLVLALMAGGCLAASGVILQATVRNPLASPELVGVTGGAALGAFTLLLIVDSVSETLLPFAAFAGGIGALVLVLVLAGGPRTSPPRLALVGLAVTAVCTAITTLMVLRSTPAAGVAITWLAGSTYAADWGDITLLAIPAAILLPLAFVSVRRMDVLSLGDDTATALGLPVGAARVSLVVLGAALAAAAVAVCGAIAFVGLLAPHAARLITGGQHRRLLPVAIALGAVLLAAADAIGRTIFAPTELPSGLVVALIGAPYLAWLFWRTRG